MSQIRSHHGVTFAEALKARIKIPLLSFGGPVCQIAVMCRILVEEKQRVSKSRFLQALNFCMLLPGPEARQRVTYTGWLPHGWRGGQVAGSLFVLPRFWAILILSALYAGFQGFKIVNAIFFGIKPMGPALGDSETEAIRPPIGRSLRFLALWPALWFVPLILVGLMLGGSHIFIQLGIFFSNAAMVTFGGAHAVLAYIAQQAVETYGWLRPREMRDGLGMAETTPGPLAQVVQFVGFLAAYLNPGMFVPLLAGILGSVIVTWVTFTRCFLWIPLDSRCVEYLWGNRILTSTLSAIMAAVVGVILNLVVWFSLHKIFGKIDKVHVVGIRLFIPDHGTIKPVSGAIAVGAFIVTLRFRAGMFKTLAGSAAVGALGYMLLRLIHSNYFKFISVYLSIIIRQIMKMSRRNILKLRFEISKNDLTKI